MSGQFYNYDTRGASTADQLVWALEKVEKLSEKLGQLKTMLMATALALKVHHMALEAIPDTVQPSVDELKECTDPECQTCKLIRNVSKYLETGAIPEELKEP